MTKVIFIVTAGGEAELMQPLYGELVDRDDVEVLAIDTGMLCCDKQGKQPAETLDKLGMLHKSLFSYGTSNIVEILKKEYPDVVVVGSDQEYMRRSFVYAANGLNIPTLLLDLGISANITNTVNIAVKRTIYRLTNYFTKIVRKYCYLLRTVVALKWNPYRVAKMVARDFWVAFTIDDDRGNYGCKVIAIAGSWEKKILIERGVNPDKIVITGNPIMGIVALGNDGYNTDNLRGELGIKKDAKVILLITQAQVEHGRWTIDMCESFINGVIDSIAPILTDLMRLVIKIHPAESLKDYIDIINNKKEDIIVRKDLILTHIINESDVVLVGGCSTVVLEASALGKPVILLNTFNEIKGIPFAEMGLAVEVYDLSKLRSKVEEYIYDELSRGELLGKAKQFFGNNREFTDGKATLRITNLIMDMGETHCKGNDK